MYVLAMYYVLLYYGTAAVRLPTTRDQARPDAAVSLWTANSLHLRYVGIGIVPTLSQWPSQQRRAILIMRRLVSTPLSTFWYCLLPRNMIAPLSPTIMNRATYLSVSVLSIFCKDEAEMVFRKRIFCSASVFWAYFIFCVCYWYLGGRPLIKLLCGHPQLLKLSISSPTRNFQTAPTSQTVLYNLSIITSFIYQLQLLNTFNWGRQT